MSPFACGTPSFMREASGVSALPTSIWPQAMSYASPSSAVDFVRPVIACLVVVYAIERGQHLVAAFYRNSAIHHFVDRAIAERLHAIVKANAPMLAPKLWYGMPAYAKDGKVVCFFQNAQKFKTRYATLGFSDKANLDEGNMWPTAFALTKLTGADERRIRALVKKAVS